MAEYQQRVEGWLEPIPGDLPAGPDARYEPAHEAIRATIAELDSPTGDPIDWSDVIKQCGDLLSSQSKDILIASYAAYGFYQTDGMAGLASGLWLIAELSDRYWETCWPKLKRIRPRVNAIDWMTERVNLTLPDTPLGPNDHATVAALSEAAKRLSDVVRDKFEDSAPALRPLLENIQRLELSLPAPAEAPAAAEPAPAAPAASELAPAAPPAAPAPTPAAEAPAAAPAPAPADSAPAGDDGPDPEAKLDSWAEPFIAPIPGDLPAGPDCRYEDDYGAIDTEISKLESPTGDPVDWKQVEQDGGTFLKGRSKDILIGSYLTAAMYDLRTFEGLAQGLAILGGIIDTFWDECWPKKKRIRARANAVAWLIARTENIGDLPLQQSDREAVTLLDAACKRFSKVLRDRFEDQAPGIRPLLDNVQRLMLSVPEPEPEPEPAPAPAAPEPAPAAAQPAAQPAPAAAPPPQAASSSVSMPEAASFSGVDDLVPFLQKVGKSLSKAGRELFKADKANPAGYRLTRLGLYMHMEEPPPVTSGQQTGVPAPPPPTVTQLDTLFSGQKWAALLEEAESGLGPRRFWLDQHRYVAMALGGLGHRAAQQAVVASTASLLERMPEVRDLQFADGTPFASAATLEWFDTEVISSGDEGGGGGDGLTDEEREAFAAARKLAAGGKGSEAVEMLSDVGRSARSGAVEFRARYAMPQACAASGSNCGAGGLFNSLYDDIDRFQLDRWDPDLAGECLLAHCKVLQAMVKKNKSENKSDPSVAERLSLVYARLCRVSPSAALQIAN